MHSVYSLSICYWLLLFISLSVLFYHRIERRKFTLAVFGLLIIGSLIEQVGILSWLLFVLISAPLNYKPWRYQWITIPALKLFKNRMPVMSQTEKESIHAGTVWWDAELFNGDPNWQRFFDIPQPNLSQEEKDFIDGPVNEVCQMTNDYQITHQLADLPPEIWQYIKENKFFALIIKKQYGGLEFSAYAQSIILQKLAGISAVLSSTVGVPNSLGPGELLQAYGTDAQKDYYLPRLAKGIEVPCFALTSPEAGSDASSIPDEGIVTMGTWEGKKVLGMSITWKKRYITLAPIATVLGLAFKLKDPEHLLGDTVDLGITCALIPTHLKGIQIGRRHFPLNIPFQNGPTEANQLFVPIDFIIGGQKMAGQGWRMLMECLAIGRAITLPSSSTGNLKSVAIGTGAYARIRRQFKLPIGKMEGIEEPLARIAGYAYMMDAASALTVSGIDLGEKPAVISAIVKYHCTEKGQKGIIDAMNITGGKGICLGQSNFLARGYQGAPIAITVEGANILTRSLIIFGQGIIRCHPYILSEIKAATETSREKQEADFDQALMGHLSFAISNMIRSIWLGITDGRSSNAPVSCELKSYYQKINRYSAHLAFLSDLSMALLGGKLKRKERLSARLGDMVSQLYFASAVLKRYHDDGEHRADLPLVHWCLQTALYDTEQAMIDFLDNFPMSFSAFCLRRIVLPLGTRRKRPSDRLDSKLARIIQIPSDTRARIGRHQYFTPCPNNPVGNIEKALHDILRAEPIYKKICKLTGKKLPFIFLDKMAAMGLEKQLISEKEAEQLILAEQGRLATINVDDFDPKELPAST